MAKKRLLDKLSSKEVGGHSDFPFNIYKNPHTLSKGAKIEVEISDGGILAQT